MKKIILTLFALASVIQACAQKKANEKISTHTKVDIPVSSKIKKLKTEIMGTWTITNIDGKVYYRNVPTAPEIEIPLNTATNFKFSFGINEVIIKDGGNVIKKTSYKILDNGTTLVITDYTSNEGVGLNITGNKMTMTQTPESYYATLSKSMNLSLEETKKQFRIPSNIIIHFTK